MTTPMATTLQTDSFCKCEGCIKKVEKTLRKLDAVSVVLDPKTGDFTFITTKHKEEIQYVLERAFPKRNIIVSQEINHSPSITPNLVIGYPLEQCGYQTLHNAPPLESSSPPQQTTIKPPADQPILATPNLVYGYPDPEIYGFMYNDPPMSSSSTLPPPQTNYIMPSAPPMPTTSNLVYGYLREFIIVLQKSSKWLFNRSLKDIYMFVIFILVIYLY
ncbi:hypothetical protein QVD17_36000 [Tagetes erecta]|uniref:HMA domain-containing protein n=1 Tax=Tagetes erecta TaxID=13708 RepID=A0AAD8NH03_TARER|nr:hypothetical protein QVD17_36000 [Tagetes erecta]